MSRNGYTRTWRGSRPAMQAWRHSGGPVIQLLLNSRRMFTSARHSAHLVIYSVSRVVVMMLSMIAGPHISVLTNVNLVMDTLVKRRAVASGMSFHVVIFTSLTPLQCWTFRAACVCLGILYMRSLFLHAHFLGVLLMFTCVESLANSRARKGVWVNALRFEHTHIYHRLLIICYKISNHGDDEHMCSARVHACGEVRYSKTTTTDTKPPPALRT
jgi:hypothetical protein